ncbi:MAG: hypothetical protein RLZZ623_2046 [Actinomycetota bacterium]|jgi:uncharacterized protein YndB with AHSA1/START domain
MSKPSDVETVERFIAAPAASIFALIADPNRHHEIDGSGTVQHTNGEASGQLELGTKFGMAMKAGFSYSMLNTVVEFEQDRCLAWQTTAANSVMARMVGGRIWRYELEPADGGTMVRESWDIGAEKLKLLVLPLRSRTRTAMAATLERIEKIVTA